MVKGDQEANAKSSISIMALEAKKDEKIVVRDEGEDAEEVVERLAELISNEEPWQA